MILSNFWYQFVCIVILGLIMGSFYNVLIIRTISGESILFPPSKCPICNTQLKWWQNIPVISYLILKGKCYKCCNRIDIIYPTIEILSACIYGVLFIKFGLSIKFLFSLIVLSLFLVLAGMDIKAKMISVKYSIMGILSAILFNYTNILNSILGLFVGIVSIYLLRKFLNSIFNKEIIGEGDIYAIAFLSALCGYKYIWYMFISVLLFEFIFFIPSFIKKIIDNSNYKLGLIFIWFIISYILMFLVKIYVIDFGMLFRILIFLNLICAFLFLCKYLILMLKDDENPSIVPFSPSMFLTAFLFLFFI